MLIFFLKPSANNITSTLNPVCLCSTFFPVANLLPGNMRKVYSKSITLNINLLILTRFPATIGNRLKERASQNHRRKLLKLHAYF